MKYLVLTFDSYGRLVQRIECSTLTQARKTAKEAVSKGANASGIIDTDKPGYRCFAKFGDQSLIED